MSLSIKEFISTASNTFGIKIHEHQINRIKNEIAHYINEKALNPVSLLNSIRNQQAPYYNDFIDIITVQESYFFRDQVLFLYLKNHFLPGLIQKKKEANELNFRVWSAGTSYGEELYSIVILFKELLGSSNPWKLLFLGTDINKHALDVAETGIYNQSGLRSTTSYYKNLYFKQEGKKYKLIDEIKENTEFKVHNLKDPTPPSPLQFDLILCRNALIYLNNQCVNTALSVFEKALSDTGALFLGPSDLITYNSHHFNMNQDLNVFYYTKIKEPPLLEKTFSKPIETPAQEAPLSFVDRVKSRSTGFSKIKKSIDEMDYEDALLEINPLLVEKPDSVLLHRYKAQALIGLGDNLTAINSLKRAVKLDPSDPKTHYFMGLCYVEEGHMTLAQNALNQALSLKPNFPEANHALALVLLNDKAIEEGLERLKIAHDQAVSSGNETKLLASNENMMTFADSIDKEIKYYRDYFDEQGGNRH